VPSSASSEINIATRPSLVYHQLRNSDCLFKRFPRAHHVLLLFSLAPKHTPTVKCLPRLPPQMRYISPRPEAFFLSHPKPSRSQPYIRNAAVLTLMFFCFSLSLSLSLSLQRREGLQYMFVSSSTSNKLYIAAPPRLSFYPIQHLQYLDSISKYQHGPSYVLLFFSVTKTHFETVDVCPFVCFN
jgi:hypothetical protein